MSTPSTAPVLTAFRGLAALVAVGTLVQAGLGGAVAADHDNLKDLHGVIGMITCAIAVLAGVAAVLWKRQGGNPGLMGHALGTAVLTVVQVGLGEIGDAVEAVHITLGVAILLAGVSLATLAFRKPYATASAD